MKAGSTTILLKMLWQLCSVTLLSVGGAFALVEATGWTLVLDAGVASPYFIAVDGLAVTAMLRGWSPEDMPAWGLALMTLAGVAGGAAILAWS